MDLSGGWMESECIRPWTSSTLVNSFSVGKGILSILLAHALSNSHVTPNDTLASHWPDLARSTMGNLTIKELSGHRAGLPALSQRLSERDLYNWLHMVGTLVQQKPWWEPGTAHGYHVNTFGFLVGEIIARIGRTTHRELLHPLRNFVGDEMFWGVPFHRLDDVATLYWHEEDQQRETLKTLPTASMHVLAYNNPSNFSGMGAVNTTAWRQCVHPSTNLHTTARAVASAYETVCNSTLGIHSTILQEATATVSRGTDVVLGAETHFGMGFQLPTATRRFGPNDEAFGHYGAGGSMGFYDPVSQLCVGYVMNQMGRGWQNSRNQTLIDAIFSCL
ncbi:unannotated protein [freshwater metagenome]|uniref:Unannotated protein n=1 Tax=freshwater metagenome TaxID=449393 RepID=A0A6J6K3Q2_9ZZZZ